MIELNLWFLLSETNGSESLVYNAVTFLPRFYYAPNNTLEDLQAFVILA